jgi:hypothetical protein
MVPLRIGVLLALAAGLLPAALLHAQSVRIDVGPGQVPANGPSVLPVISFDGRYTAFVSMAGNLVAGDANGHADRWRRRSAPTSIRPSSPSATTGGGSSSTAREATGSRATPTR